MQLQLQAQVAIICQRRRTLSYRRQCFFTARSGYEGLVEQGAPLVVALKVKFMPGYHDCQWIQFSTPS